MLRPHPTLHHPVPHQHHARAIRHHLPPQPNQVRGYQHGNALTVAGLATLLTNAVPIVFGTIVLKEPVPPGVWGGLRLLAYLAVTAGAILLATPDKSAPQSVPASAQSGA